MHPAILRAAAGCAVAAFLSAACSGSKNPHAPTPVPSCAYVLSLTSAVAPAAGQSFIVHVDTAAACSWTARPQAAWLGVGSPFGVGPADIVVTVAVNDAAAERVGTIMIVDSVLSVRQSGKSAPCSFSLESPSSTFGPEGGAGRLTVATAAGCTWNASASAPWITLRTVSGTGPGEILYEVPRYDGSLQREARISVDQASFTVRQDPPVLAPCVYAVDPTTTLLHWHGAAGDGFDVRLTTAAHCGWTAVSSASWIILTTAAAGTGSTTMRVQVGAYTAEPTRTAPLMIRWPAETAGQNVWITQEGCRYAISITTDAVPAAGGRRRVSVFGTPVTTSCSIGCPWAATSGASWIHIVGATTRAGDDDLFYDVDANTTGALRTGTLTMAGRTIVVTQGG